MPYQSEFHHRRSIRLRGHDYAGGAYFITIVTYGRECLFGSVIDGAMHLNVYGQVVADEWGRTPIIRAEMEMDAFVIMPNHIHGVVYINCRGDRRSPRLG